MFSAKLLTPLIALYLMTTGSPADAAAIASIYNGDQYQLAGQFLVQDSDHPENFYVMPKKYRLKRKKRERNEETGEYGKKGYEVNHRVITKGDKQFSVYTLSLELDEPTPTELLMAAMMLRREAGVNAIVKGAAPICGIRLGVLGFDNSKESLSAGEQNPNAEFIKYSISSTEAAKCNSLMATNEFNIQYRVPIEMEPAIAQNLTTNVGMTLPPVELILPYKYKDSVVLEFDANSVVEQLKAAVGVEGTIKVVSFAVNASVEQMMNRLRMTGRIHRDCQNPDKSICDRYEQQAGEMLSKMVLTYLPMAGNGDTNPLVLADKDKSMSGGLFKVQMAADYQSAIRDGKFRIDFSNVVYDMVHAQAQIEAKGVPVDVLDPAVRKLLE